MNIKKKKFKIIITITSLFLLFYIFGNYLLYQDTNNKISKKIKESTPVSIKNFLKKTIFYVPLLKKNSNELKIKYENVLSENKKLDLENIKLKNKLNYGSHKKKVIKSKKKIYELNEFIVPFYDDNNIFNNKRSGYIEIINDFLIIFFTAGKSLVVNLNNFYDDDIYFKSVKNNIQSKKLFNAELKWTGIKDVKIIDEEIYISLTKEIKKNCYNTAIFKGKMNFSNIEFEDLNLVKGCVNIDSSFISYPSFKNFNGYQTGGRIIFDNKNIYLTLGDYNQWDKVQDNETYFGKILKIDKNNNNSKIISKGHRNSQGMYNLSNSKIISSEHGPKGGDEINIVDLSLKQIQNFGWPVASYGDHYDSVPLSKQIKKISPLLKNHKKNGFIEPVFYFKKSIGISEIIKNYFSDKNSFFITSLKEKKIYEIEFDKNFKNPNIVDEIFIGERIRDIIYNKKNNLYYLYLEDTPKVATLKKISN